MGAQTVNQKKGWAVKSVRIATGQRSTLATAGGSSGPRGGHASGAAVRW